MTSSRILVTFPPMMRNPGRHMEILKEAGCEVRPSLGEHPLPAEALIGQVGDVDAIIAGGDKIAAEVIAAAPRLKVISRHGVGYDNVDLEAATRAGIPVTITAGGNHVSVAELALGLIITLSRDILNMAASVRAGRWSRVHGIEVTGKTLGIVGFGRIGKTLAKRARGLEMNVLAYDVEPDRQSAEALGVRFAASFEDLLRQSDFVSLHVPGSRNGRHLIGEAELALMKPTAYLINTARGSLIDEKALYRSLSEKRIAGAALDVFAEEPTHALDLVRLGNLVPLPHIGGSTKEAAARTALMAAENTLQVLRGEKCPSTVNPEVYVGRAWSARHSNGAIT